VTSLFARFRFPGIGTIRSRLLIAFIFTVILVALAISGVTVVLGSRDGRQRVTAQLQSVVTLKEAEINSWINSLNVNLNIISSDEIVSQETTSLLAGSNQKGAQNPAYSSLQNRLKWASEGMGLFDELFLMDTDGTVLISTNPSHEGQQHAVDDFFIEGIKRSYVQQPSYSLSLGRMTLVASAPVIKNGKALGVLAGRANLDSLNLIMIERTGLGETGETYLIGANYRLLTDLRNGDSSASDIYVRSRGGDSALASRTSGTASYLNYAGEPVIGVYKYLPELKSALIAEQQASEALSGTRTALVIIGIVAIAAVLLSSLLARRLTTTIVRPLSELASTATLISQGDLSQAARVERKDEVGTLAKAFNTMTQRLLGTVNSLERRTIHLRAVNEVGRHFSSILQVDQLLDYVAISLQKTFGYQSVSILLSEQGGQRMALKARAQASGDPDQEGKREVEGNPLVASVRQSGQPKLINDPSPTSPDRESVSRAELAVPIKIAERTLGVLHIEDAKSEGFDEQDLFTAQTMADQMAIALENARLYQEAQELATMKERQRLARDLHDAVSQTLFSASLIADVLPRLWGRNPGEGQKRLEEIRQLTRGALAEMRTLLLELRPAALADAEIGELLRQLAASIAGRARIPVNVEIGGQCQTPPEVKVALYRIAQEALNNVAKHSGASSARVSLTCTAQSLDLAIEDNGRGFNQKNASIGSLGLGIMQERARGIAAQLTVQSQEGQGTTVYVRWRAAREEE
jgi:signal transduction histidine kinase